MTLAPAEDIHAGGNRAVALRILEEHGYETVCFQSLQRGMKLWFSKRHAAMVGYVTSGRHWITVGGPIGSRDHLAEIAEEFESTARQSQRRICYMCAERHTADPLTAAGRGKLLIGAIPIWNPQNWSIMVAHNAPLRYQIARARRRCTDVNEIDPLQAARSMDIQNLVGQWLCRRRLMPMRFLADPFILSDAARHRRIFTLADSGGQLAAVLAASPVPARNGMFIEQVIRAPHTPNGSVELIISHAMAEFSQTYRHVTLGLVGGSQFAADDENPQWAKIARYSARRWGGWLYRFRSLERFRASLQPETWEPVYAVSDRSRVGMGDVLSACRAMFRFPFFNFRSLAAITRPRRPERPADSEAKWISAFFHND